MHLKNNKKVTTKDIREWNGKHLNKGKCPDKSNDFLSYDSDCMMCRLVMQIALISTTDKN